MDLKEIKSLIKVVYKYEIDEIKIQIGKTTISIKNNIFLKKKNYKLVNQNNNQEQYYSVSDSEKNFNNNGYFTIKSPMIGTFYRRSNPNQDPFVKIGDNVKIGTKICIIEAMKLFNDIESEVEGKIVKIFVEDSTPVDYNQPLFLIKINNN
ncbi:acetyl-CoA carboxylase biotin carboxyl carrier protein [Blattabacterium cuenoti]|uniref:acetyl-CoA carboxylase biotin carboxyl carrier protein n=1 Tax=Blattabacterium cuenoti TaxID=1653831 RepID=UPI00163B827A|nr:acetyl-CoA carboxylase biotin carboxyl carrier protein [Blattabacterium cuenoti]